MTVHYIIVIAYLGKEFSEVFKNVGAIERAVIIDIQFGHKVWIVTQLHWIKDYRWGREKVAKGGSIIIRQKKRTL